MSCAQRAHALSAFYASSALCQAWQWQASCSALSYCTFPTVLGDGIVLPTHPNALRKLITATYSYAAVPMASLVYVTPI